MKIKLLVASLAVVSAVGWFASAKSSTTEIQGTVKRLLMNPEGDVDGFVLENGQQVNFPPHMSSQLTAVVATSDAVSIKGFKENEKVFKAETVTNTKTAKSVTETPPRPPAPPIAGPEPPPPPLPGPGRRAGLKELVGQGKIEQQIYGRRGEVHGVVLSDGTIVHLGPKLMDSSKAKFTVGQNLKVLGFGTETNNGKSIEATDVSNQN